MNRTTPEKIAKMRKPEKSQRDIDIETRKKRKEVKLKWDNCVENKTCKFCIETGLCIKETSVIKTEKKIVYEDGSEISTNSRLMENLLIPLIKP